MADFDAKLNRRHRNSWRGQEIEVEVTEDGKRVMTIHVGRRDAYKQGDPSEYEVKVINVTGEEHVEVTLMELGDKGHTGQCHYWHATYGRMKSWATATHHQT